MFTSVVHCDRVRRYGLDQVSWEQDRLLWRVLFVGYAAAVLWFSTAAVGGLIADVALQHGAVPTTGVYGVRYAPADANDNGSSLDDNLIDAGTPGTVTFRADGRIVHVVRPGVVFGPWPRDGDLVDVSYDAADPTRAVVAGQPTRDHLIFSIVLVLLAITTVGPSLRRYLTGRT